MCHAIPLHDKLTPAGQLYWTDAERNQHPEQRPWRLVGRLSLARPKPPTNFVPVYYGQTDRRTDG